MPGPWEAYAKPSAGASSGPWNAYRPQADDTVPGTPPQPTEQPDTSTALDKLKGAWEAGLGLLTGATGGALGYVGGTLGGIAGSIARGDIGTPEATRRAEQSATEGAQKLTYQPRTAKGQEYLGKAAEVAGDTLGGLPPSMSAAPSIVPALAQSRNSGASALARVQDLTARLRERGQPEMAGVGAAETGAEAIRRERAASLPVPIKLTKGEATRDFEQQRFEKEAMKASDIGEPLRQRAADNVEAVTKNFEAWVDQSGAEAPDLIGTGKAVDRALVKRMESAKAEIRNAYTKAEQSGEMAQPVSTQPLAKYLAENKSATTLAPVLKAAEDEMVRLGGATRNEHGNLFAGEMPLNDVEKMRKLIVRLAKTDDTNGHFGGEINKVIDSMTEGKGGDLYQKARGMFKDYANEFKNQGAVRKLVSTKPGTNDRAVALEDVFNHSVLSGSNQDTVNILSSLEKSGPEGAQAIKELRGATINHLLGVTTGGAARDIRGQPIPSFGKLDKAVKSLDADGKLDLIFGKKQAEQIRDLKELVGDISTAPPGAVNTSNTAAVIKEALLALGTGHVPTAIAKTIQGMKQAVGDRRAMKRVRDALAQPDEEMSSGGNTVH